MDDTADKIAQFSAITGADPSVAQTALGASNWDLEAAVGLFFAAGDEQASEGEEGQPTSSAPAQSNPQSASSTNKAKSNRKPKGPTTIRDLQAGGDDDDDDDKKRDLFAGGEKSGLAVTDPNQGDGGGGGPVDHFRNIMNQARQNRDRPGGEGEEDDTPQSSHFMGRAQTLGGDDAPSRVVQDPTASTSRGAQPPPRVTRTLHLWADGVSIDDGPLLRFDDPANEHIMQEINQGRAPKALLDVQPDQEVDLNLDPHKGENYVAPKPKYKPFAGSGQRLGSPTPGLASSSTASTAQAAPAAAAAQSQPKQEEMQVDESQPFLQMQIRLGDGTRLASRFNTTHTMGDVYDFVDRASPTSQQRAYVLQTTFPIKELTDKSQVLGEMGDFKRGGVVVQKWK